MKLYDTANNNIATQSFNLYYINIELSLYRVYLPNMDIISL